MSNRMVGPIAAGALAVGILVGVAGTIVVRDATARDRYEMGAGMGGVMPMIGGPMMDGVGFDDMAELHAQHHGTDR